MEVQRIPKRTVSVIEPQKSILVDKEKYHQKRVAAYCRVSTDSEEQLTSYQNQMRVYTEMIAANKEWEFAGLYADAAVIIGLKTLRLKKCQKHAAFELFHAKTASKTKRVCLPKVALGSAGALFLCPDAGEGGVIVKAYGKSWGYNVYDCRYCLYRKGKLKGCVYPDGCCCPVPQKPARRNGIEQVYEANADNAAPVSECEGCPYGRAAPCIGWCTKEVMRAAGLPKERDRSHV